MLFRISNVARDYAWGSKTLIPEYFEVPATGHPMAEIWYGTHAGSMAKVAETGEPLQAAIGHQLSFLLKILAAETPLSIQAHPNTEQAKAGFARENALGIDLNSSNRNYKDEHHKPEMLVALTEFQALSGFKSTKQIQNILADLAELPSLSQGFKDAAGEWQALLAGGGIKALVTDLLARRDTFLGFTIELAGLAEFEAQYELAHRLNELYPGDPGVLIAMFMNHLWLEPGEAVYLPAGEIHAYLSGLGVEVMAASDNVLRGGLTQKHIDITELESVLNFEPSASQPVKRKPITAGVFEYPVPINDFKLFKIQPIGGESGAVLELPGEAIILVTEGSVSASNSLGESLELHKSQSAYASKGQLRFSGTGTAFVASGPAA